MIFARPENLYLLLLLIPFGMAWLFYARWRRRVINRTGDQPLIQAMISSADQGGANIARALQIAGITLLIVALAQPQWGMSDEEIEQESLDIVFALDLSRSMLAEDIAPNRLMAAHQELNQVMERLKGDRVGLVIFTSLSFVQSPLTTDYGAIDFFLRRLHPDQIPVGGTSIGAAMSDALDVLTGRKRQGDDHNFQRAENQVILLMTDGEDHESSPIAAAEQAREAGIRVVTVGIGSREGAPIPQFDERGNRTGNLRDRQGETVITKLGEDTLQQMAQLTGGTYIHFERPGQVTSQLISFLDELERSAFEAQISRRYIDRFYLFLLPGVLLLIISLFLGHRRSWRPLKLRRLFPLALAALLFTTGCHSALQKRDPTAEQAAQAIEDGEFEEALQLLDSIADDHDQTPQFHLNRGRALLGLERFDEARQAFARALSASDSSLRADAHYHMGLSFAAEERWDDARQSFQQGLALFLTDTPPEDRELFELLRENLEVALQKLYPPCPSLKGEDQLPRNSPQEAMAFEELPLEDQVLCGPEPELFVLPVMVDGSLSVEVELRQLREIPDPEHHFLPHQAGVQLVIYDSAGESILTIDKGLSDNQEELEKINRRQRFTRKIEDFIITPEHLGAGTEGTILIALEADPGLEFAFDLNLDFIPSCEALEDDFEPNNSAHQAAPIPPGQHQLHLCPGDEDWFEISADKAESLFIDLIAEPDQATKKKPALSLELLARDGHTVLAETHEDGQFLTTGLQDLQSSQTMLLRVVGTDEDQQGPYSLHIHHHQACPDPPSEDSPPQVQPLSEEIQQLRYQRLCPGYTDLYGISPDEDGHIKWSLSTLPRGLWEAGALKAQDFPAMTMNLLDLQTASVVATATPTAPLSDDDDTHGDDGQRQDDEQDEPLSLTRDQLLTVEDPSLGDHAILEIRGEPGFYHLQRQNDQDQDQDNDDQQDQQDQQDQDQDDDDQDSQEDDQDSDDDHDPDEQDQEDDQDDQQDQASDDDEEEESRDQEEDGEQDEQEQEQEQEPEEELSEETLQLLRSLEEMDDNFQLQRRFENMPQRPVERDW